jgi:2-polyprenyl-6-methoxyphenol hydroxylase-like FAD-dependent oxidoreductase
MREYYTEALVVGAGPVGLTAALLLAKAGIETRIIDREHQTASRSYACALHPSALSLLSRLGLTGSC